MISEGHLRWDSLGEFMALSASLEHLAQVADNNRAQILADTLDSAVGKILDHNKSPSRKKGEIDNRGSHFYLALYWAQALAEQNKDTDLKVCFAKLYNKLSENRSKIVEELGSVQGKAVEIGGYYRPDPKLAAAVMRPSATLNDAIDNHAC